jgi:C4-dicarboxylate-specific signal transduction histidine kinase
VARGVEATALLLSPLVIGRKVLLWGALGGLMAGALGAVWGALAGWWPVAYVEGEGLTTFKVGVEYGICGVLALAAATLYQRRALVSPESARLMLAATALTIVGELSLTIYVDVDGHANALGHLLMLASFFCVYKATIQKGLMLPYDTLFRALQQRGVQLSASRDMLADLVAERTRALKATNALLRDEIAERQRAEQRLLLAISRDDPGPSPLPTDLAAEVSALRPTLSTLVGPSVTLHLDLDLDPAEGLVMLAPSLIEQVLMNLTVNAKDAMPQGGALSITLRAAQSDLYRTDGLPPGRYAYLRVQDTGCGMSPDTLSRIFEPFFTTKGPDKGTGLGLPTVYGIVRRCGGHIRVESAPGAGTTLHIYFPRLAPSP